MASAQRHKQVYDERQDSGLCPRCGSGMDDRSKKTCGSCRTYSRELKRLQRSGGPVVFVQKKKVRTVSVEPYRCLGCGRKISLSPCLACVVES